MTRSASSRWRGRDQRPHAGQQRLGVDGHVVRGDQHQEQRAEHARGAEADRGDRADQPARVVGVLVREVLDAVGDLARLRAGEVRHLVAQVVDDAGHVVHELVGLVDERRDDQRDHPGQHAKAEHDPDQRPDRPRDLQPALQPVGERRQRDGHDHGDQDRQQQRDELLEQQPQHQQAGGQQDRPVGDGPLARFGHQPNRTRSGSRSPRRTAGSTSTQSMPRDSASTRAWGLIWVAASTPRQEAKPGSAARRSR